MNMPAGGVPLIGQPKKIQLNIAVMCTVCFPLKVSPGIFIYNGKSLCGEHMGEIRDAEIKKKSEEEGESKIL